MNIIFTRIFKGLISILPIMIIALFLHYVYTFFLIISQTFFGITSSLYSVFSIWVLTFVTLYLIGLSYEKNKKLIFQVLAESLIKKMPFLKTIYSVLEDTLAMFFQSSKDKYLGVIEIDYAGYPQFGFITKYIKEEDRYIVFVPTAPNPTNGFVILLDKNNPKYPYKIIDIEPKEALSKVISLGLK